MQQSGRPRRPIFAASLIAGIVLSLPLAVNAEVYIYQGPNGERLITDRPPSNSGYSLVAKRDTIANVGHIMADRPIIIGGPDSFRGYINSASARYQVDPALVEAVIKVESDFNPNAVSRAGATGLMQLMQKTAEHYQVYNRFNPHQNINGGVAHLRDLLDRYDGDLPLVLAAYNAGSTAVARYKGIPPFPETRRYVAKVLKAHSEFRQYRYGSSD
jgi:soluble lytic murein transglycosylase-like protein